MTATSEFFNWFYTGLNGLGGWFIFLVIALISVTWLIYDSSVRSIKAPGWRLATFLTAALLLPSIIYRFSSPETQLSLTNFVEWIFYLGLLGGTIPPVLAVGYYVTYQQGQRPSAIPAAGQRPVEQGQGYPQQPVSPRREPTPRRGGAADFEETEPPPRRAPRKAKASAWLKTNTGKTYQLNKGETSIGRQDTNDIRLDDKSVSREHAKIREQNERYTLIDLGSKGGTWLNGERVRGQVQLEPDDEISFSNTIAVTFISEGR